MIMRVNHIRSDVFGCGNREPQAAVYHFKDLIVRYTEYDTPSGVMGFDIDDDSASVSSVRGRDTELIVPDSISFQGADFTVSRIGRKSFLSDKYLHELSIPVSVTYIDDWAFAGCKNLRSISMGRKVLLGNGVFKDCRLLERVIVQDADSYYADGCPSTDGSHKTAQICRDKDTESKIAVDASYLLAAVIRLMDNRFLFDPVNAGTKEWFANWDRRMIFILSEPDEEGFSALLACGEEDYEGRDNTIEAYLARRRRRKVRICALRLLHDSCLSDDDRKTISAYLYDHRAGTDSPSFWEVVLREHGDDEEYYKLMCDLGCVDISNIDIMLDDLGQSHPGMKSYLIRFTSGSDEGFLDSMEL